MIGAPTISLGLVPTGKRTVTPMPLALKKLVPLPVGKNETIKPANADPVQDTVPLIRTLIKRQAWQGKKVAQALQGATLEETLRNNWNFIFRHIQYQKDPDGSETVRSLRRLVYDGRGDCDCFTNALGNILLNQGIPFKMRVVGYNGSPDFSHIYIIVPNGKSYYTLDPVVHQFNYEVQPTRVKDFSMKLESLDGFYSGYLGACPPKPGQSTAVAPSTASAAATPPKTVMVNAQTLAAEGLRSVSDLLFGAGYTYKKVNDGYEVQTKFGPRMVPAVIPFAEGPNLLKSLEQPLPPPQPPATTPAKEPATSTAKKIVGFSVLASIVALALMPGSSGGSVNGISRKTPRKKVLAFAQL